MSKEAKELIELMKRMREDSSISPPYSYGEEDEYEPDMDAQKTINVDWSRRNTGVVLIIIAILISLLTMILV